MSRTVMSVAVSAVCPGDILVQNVVANIYDDVAHGRVGIDVAKVLGDPVLPNPDAACSEVVVPVINAWGETEQRRYCSSSHVTVRRLDTEKCGNEKESDGDDDG